MPTYVYRCARCTHEFERFEKMSASPRPACPECGAQAERQITGGAGIAVRSGAHAASPTPPEGCCGGGMCGLN